jgi:hypothetical protein
MSGPEVLVPIAFFATVGAIFISRSEIGRAIAHRIRGVKGDEEVRAELADLRREMDQVRAELAEAHDRLDFTERLLSQARAPEQFPRGVP